MLNIKAQKHFNSSRFNLDIDIHIPNTNENTVFFGASGSGKTLTMQIIAGLVQPDSGLVSLNGKIFYDSAKKIRLKPQKRHIGYMLQDYALFPNLNILQNVAYCRSGLLGKYVSRKEKAKAMELLRRFEIEHLSRQYPSQISGGQKQRTAIARALNAEPDLLLFDEPFSALDPLLRANMRASTLELLKSASIPAIIISHDPEDVDTFAGNLILFKNGRSKIIKDYKQLRPQFSSSADCLIYLQENFQPSQTNAVD